MISERANGWLMTYRERAEHAFDFRAVAPRLGLELYLSRSIHAKLNFFLTALSGPQGEELDSGCALEKTEASLFFDMMIEEAELQNVALVQMALQRRDLCSGVDCTVCKATVGGNAVIESLTDQLHRCPACKLSRPEAGAEDWVKYRPLVIKDTPPYYKVKCRNCQLEVRRDDVPEHMVEIWNNLNR
jgi:hypothetical protein